jgi:hypothetical protein
MKLIDDAIKASKPVNEIESSLNSCAEQIGALSVCVKALLQRQELLFKMIEVIRETQQIIIDSNKKLSTETALLDAVKTVEENKKEFN